MWHRTKRLINSYLDDLIQRAATAHLQIAVNQEFRYMPIFGSVPSGAVV
jgi:hypothetical protein